CCCRPLRVAFDEFPCRGRSQGRVVHTIRTTLAPLPADQATTTRTG
ncbi:MAG: hypothetical protein AVDCRST_MAG61-1345, partial [uncultured Friedmanniella sp.]